jgi:hypothetical protein
MGSEWKKERERKMWKGTTTARTKWSALKNGTVTDQWKRAQWWCQEHKN